MSFNKLKQRVNEVAETSHDMHNTSSGGGGFTVLDDDFYYGYLCQFIEWGNHPEEVNGVAKGVYPHFSYSVAIFHNDDDENDYILLDNGSHRFGQTLKTSDRASAVKMFRGLNVDNDPSKTHIAQFLGEPRVFKVLKKKSKAGREFNTIDFAATTPAVEGRGKNRVVVELPMIDEKDIKVFFWEHPTLEDWDKLYIEPQEFDRDDGTKYVRTNFLQEKLVAARNFEGSALQELLETQEGGFDLSSYQTAQEASEEVKEDKVDLPIPEDDEDDVEDVEESQEEVEEKPKPKPSPRKRPSPRKTITSEE